MMMMMMIIIRSVLFRVPLKGKPRQELGFRLRLLIWEVVSESSDGEGSEAGKEENPTYRRIPEVAVSGNGVGSSGTGWERGRVPPTRV